MTTSSNPSNSGTLCNSVYVGSIDAIVQLASEPSIAFYRIQENVRKTIPQLIQQRNHGYSASESIGGVCFDIDHSLNALAAIPIAQKNLDNLLNTLKSSITLQQELIVNRQKRQGGLAEEDEIEIGVDLSACIDHN